MNNNHVLSFYTKELDKLKQELDKEVRYYSASSILSICKQIHKEGSIDRDELLMIHCKHREVINQY